MMNKIAICDVTVFRFMCKKHDSLLKHDSSNQTCNGCYCRS